LVLWYPQEQKRRNKHGPARLILPSGYILQENGVWLRSEKVVSWKLVISLNIVKIPYFRKEVN
jgi:hypothetical protein